MPIKMYAIFSKEGVAKMGGNKGKMCAQAGHAYLHAWWDAENLLDVHFVDQMEGPEIEFYRNEYERLSETISFYRHGDDARKIALLVDTDQELLDLAEAYKGFTGTTIVEDCGYTVVEPGTMTCIGIGPLRDEEKGDDLRACRLFLA